MRSKGLNAALAVYIPLQNAIMLTNIAENARRRPTQIILQSFLDQSVLLGLESGALSWHDVNESSRDEWARNLSQLQNRCMAMLKLQPVADKSISPA